MAELIVSILVLLVAARALGEIFERFRQSSMIGEILAGIILGPALLRFIYEPNELADLGVVASLGTFMIVLLAGLEMKFDDIARAIRGGGLVVGSSAFIVPFVLGYMLSALLGLGFEASLVLSLAVAITALPVSVRILLDLGLTQHPVGRTIISVAVLDDLTALTLLGIILSLHANAVVGFYETLQVAVITVLKTALLVSLVLAFSFMLRLSGDVTPGAARRVRQMLGLFRGREALFAFSILFVLAFASFAQLLGLHFVVGTFFGGLLLSARFLGEHNYRQVERTTSAIAYGFLAPIFFGYIGLRLVPDALLTNPALTAAVLSLAVLGKLAGGYLGGRLAHLPHPHALALGIGLNARGMMEIVVASLAFELGLIGADLFSILVLMAVVTTMMTPTLLRRAVARADREKAGREAGDVGPAVLSPAPPPGVSAKAASSENPSIFGAPIVIVGGGRVALELARAVGPSSILERNPDQARMVASLLSEVEVHIGEATSERDLAKAGVGPGAIVLAVTDDDEANEFVVRFARGVGARRVIARTDNAAEFDRLKGLGADAVVNTAQETANTILLDLYPPDESMAEVLLQRESPAVGSPLSAIDLPRGVVVRSVSRRGHVHVPTPDLVLDARDSLILSGSPSGLERARDLVAGPEAVGHPLHVLAVHPPDLDAIGFIAREVAPLAARSRGGMVVAVPWESVNGTFAREVDEALRRQGVTASVVRGNSLSLSDLRDAIEAVRSPRIDLDGSAEEVDAPRPRPEVWLLALPRQAIGKGPGLMPPRRVPALPSATGVPVLVARHGRLPRTILALIDGAEGADKAGTLACELARHTGARLSLLVPRIEGESESLEQATFIEGYARSIGLGGIEVHYADEVNPAAIERRLVGKADLIVAPSIPRALRGRDLARLASEGDTSVLLV